MHIPTTSHCDTIVGFFIVSRYLIWNQISRFLGNFCLNASFERGFIHIGKGPLQTGISVSFWCLAFLSSLLHDGQYAKLLWLKYMQLLSFINQPSSVSFLYCGLAALTLVRFLPTLHDFSSPNKPKLDFSTLPIHNIHLTTGEVDALSANIQIYNQIRTFSNSSVSEYIIFKMKTSENIQVWFQNHLATGKSHCVFLGKARSSRLRCQRIAASHHQRSQHIANIAKTLPKHCHCNNALLPSLPSLPTL